MTDERCNNCGEWIAHFEGKYFHLETRHSKEKGHHFILSVPNVTAKCGLPEPKQVEHFKIIWRMRDGRIIVSEEDYTSREEAENSAGIELVTEPELPEQLERYEIGIVVMT